MSSGTHEKPVIEAGILEKLIDAVIVMAEKDEENVSVMRNDLACFVCDDAVAARLFSIKLSASVNNSGYQDLLSELPVFTSFVLYS